MLKMSTVRYASILAIFAVFCVNILTKSDKRFIISLQMNIGIFRNTALRCGAKYRETGCESPTQNGTVRCMFFPTAQQRGHSGETGEGFAERTGESPRTKSGYSVPISTLGFPKGAVCSA